MSPYLRPITRMTWVFLTLACGVLPSVLFFVWIERNMALPGFLYQKLGWPWVSLWDAPLFAKLGWDFTLFAIFAFFHSLLAQKRPQTFLQRILPTQCIRPFYLCFTGLSILGMMGAWQNTGVVVWLIPGLSFGTLSLLSLIIYWGLMLLALRVMRFFDPFEFLGLRQIYSRPDQLEQMSAGGALLTQGIYAKIRHPMYFFTLLAFSITPMMSLDRLLLCAASAVYLYFGIPIEERKLSERFGDAYTAYRKQVPAIFPRLSGKTHSFQGWQRPQKTIP